MLLIVPISLISPVLPISLVFITIGCFILYLLYKKKVQLLCDVAEHDKKVATTILMDIHRTIIEDIEYKRAKAEYLIVQKQLRVEKDLYNQKLQTEYEVQLTLLEEAKQLDNLRKRSVEAAQAEKLKVDQQIDLRLKAFKNEYDKMEKHFKDNIEEDITLRILSAAYAVVSSGHPPRDFNDSALMNAVIEHRKAGGPGIDLEKLGLPPKPEELN